MAMADDWETVSIFDPAIDLERSKVRRFVRTRDMQHLVFLDPQTPDGAGGVVGPPEVFVLRSLKTRYAHDVIQAHPDETQRRRLAFQACVVRVRGWRMDDRDEWVPEAVAAGLAGSGQGLTVTDDELDEFFDGGTVQEIGEVALTRTFFSKRRPKLGFGLLGISQSLLVGTPDLAAALVREQEALGGPNG